jgi:hypothetical protein
VALAGVGLLLVVPTTRASEIKFKVIFNWSAKFVGNFRDCRFNIMAVPPHCGLHCLNKVVCFVQRIPGDCEGVRISRERRGGSSQASGHPKTMRELTAAGTNW